MGDRRGKPIGQRSLPGGEPGDRVIGCGVRSQGPPAFAGTSFSLLGSYAPRQRSSQISEFLNFSGTEAI
ncbi:uncharacterized protein BP5553_05788 [Venustampulla echinocandica]|uniref:Uncharacterized protein n=1 Tax=Venustampulla echinocandica TaxID=2656787 RepID=A0A370TLN3_9HELO|nr:uncharacterized protein BP5553_05788 [Venustampulla echinocandica]RDL36436.1 hypothetical protein BP5553_05788 [Venustampulla echinocandica]